MDSDDAHEHDKSVVAIAFHPTTRLLASTAQDGQLCLWKSATSLQQPLKRRLCSANDDSAQPKTAPERPLRPRSGAAYH
ncbi:WD40 repeat domain-containing protein [Leptothoe sp. EHU-05/26/07-4]|uniref:Uncharacterized protein n=1 Tax=Adonisia turfae CCMR0081 TaxID=2292702 RepID=A0A6M0RY51_9CYAN|nr:WD40 repeat domain-containing protein [Adonisia turfae]NEZ60840.1 hypothetical protein [Adonisia turfae CCMR0081]